MTIIKPFLILLFAFMTINSLYCQKTFRDGYIVSKTGESITGLVGYSANQNTPSICNFKRFEIAIGIRYTPGDIKAFGYKSGNRYESKEYKGKVSFYEIIVSGKINVYRKGSKYYLEKNYSGLTELGNGPISYSAGGQKTDYKDLPEFLSYITEGKADIPARVNLRSDLAPLIIEYNKDSGQTYRVFKRSVTEKELSRISFESGTNKNMIGILTGINIYKLNFTNRFKKYIPVPVNEISPVNGLTYERILTRKNDKLSLRMDILYLKQTFYCYDEGKDYRGIIRNDVFFDFTGVKIPVLMQYSLTGKRLVPYFNAGIAYQFMIRHSFLHIEDVENSQHEISTYEYRDFQFRPGEISAVGGMGVRMRLFSDHYLSILGRLELGFGLFENIKEEEIMFRQNSIQSTILVGLSF